MSTRRIALLAAPCLLAVYLWANNQPEAAGLVPPPWDKLAHLVWYATLAGLLLLGGGRRVWPWVLIGTLVLAGWDEWHQIALPGRSPGVDDWLADAFGILAGMGIVWARGVQQK
jgi:VanZ family protein